jgi:transposase-like protein
MGKLRVPRTLIEAVAYFSDQDVAHDFFVQLRWPNGAACPHCGNAEVHYLPKYRRWTCKECRQQFTAKTGTIFEDSPISFSKWLPAIWLITANRNGISSMELHRALGVTQKTAWFMLHRIREALDDQGGEPFRGPVEADETYVGGLTKNMNAKRRAKYQRTWSGEGKSAVFGIVQRNTPEHRGKVRAWVIPFVEKEYLQGNIRRNVAPGEEVHTDGFPAYRGLKRDYIHQVIDHAYSYVEGHVHTNSIESFFSVFKRTIRGTYIAPRPKHLQRYVAEQVHRFNERENTDGPRFALSAKMAEGKRITYKQLIRKS